MSTRMKSGLLMVPLLAVVWVGGACTVIACVALSMLAVMEFYGAFETASSGSANPIKPSYFVPYWGIPLSVLLYFIFMDTGLLWIIIVVAGCLILLLAKKERSFTNILVTMAGMLYVVLFISFIWKIDITFNPGLMILRSGNEAAIDALMQRGDSAIDSFFRIHGFKYNFVWLVIFSAFATDIFAYVTGRALGKHKLAPTVSPNKTVEGSIGGIVGSVIICGTFGYFAMPEFFIHSILIGALGSVAAQLGDLAASAIKRRLGIKDFGNLIPGHGGILDRIDSILFTAAFVYLYLSLVSSFTVDGDMQTPIFDRLVEYFNGTASSLPGR